MLKNKKPHCLIACILTCQIAFGQKNIANFPVKELGTTIYEGVFSGNGLLGSMTYLESPTAIRIDVGRTDVYDHRQNKQSALFDKARLNIGHLALQLTDSIKAANGEVNYAKAEALANITTNVGRLQVRTLTFAERNLIYVEVSANGNNLPSYKISWIPEEAKSPRLMFSGTQAPTNYPLNPVGSASFQNGIQIYNQPLLAGGGYATAYKKIKAANKDIYLVSIGYDTTSNTYVKEAIDQIKSFSIEKLDREIIAHQTWWEKFYSKSNIDIPDQKLQQFYNMQLYKLASATRSGKPAIDLQGPWTAKTPWPAYWYNLNIQLTYSATFASNHLDIASSLIQMIDKNTKNLINNVPEKYRYNSAAIGRSSGPDLMSRLYLEKEKDDIAGGGDGVKELGNLTWMLHSYYQYYRYSMDAATYNKLFPLLKRAVNYYLHLLAINAEGKYHIAVKTFSPEYPKAYVYNTNYDLSILRWGLKTLIALDKERGGKDELHAKWVDVLKNLIPFPKNENGLLIGKDFPYTQSHRHYSHLLMIYPFYEMNWDQIENRELIRKSIAHWQSMPKALQGYSFSGAASMYAMMGKGDEAVASLNILLNKYVKPNTFYAETGPVIETPLAAMSSIQELYLQYWDGVARVFPAIPKTWLNTSFQNLLTEGGFLISAVRKEGVTHEILVQSQYTGNIKLKTDVANAKVLITGRGKLNKQENGYLEIFLAKGATAKIYPK